jgi:hypothetical protein
MSKNDKMPVIKCKKDKFLITKIEVLVVEKTSEKK